MSIRGARLGRSPQPGRPPLFAAAGRNAESGAGLPAPGTTTGGHNDHFTSPQNGAAGYRRAGRGRVFGGAATTAVQLAAAAAPADSGTVMPGTPRCHTSQLAAAFTGAGSAMLHKGVTLVLTNESDRTEHHAPGHRAGPGTSAAGTRHPPRRAAATGRTGQQARAGGAGAGARRCSDESAAEPGDIAHRTGAEGPAGARPWHLLADMGVAAAGRPRSAVAHISALSQIDPSSTHGREIGAGSGDLLHITKALLARSCGAISASLLVRWPVSGGSCPSECPSGANAHRFSVRILHLTWVELSGLEPLTSCMP